MTMPSGVRSDPPDDVKSPPRTSSESSASNSSIVSTDENPAAAADRTTAGTAAGVTDMESNGNAVRTTSPQRAPETAADTATRGQDEKGGAIPPEAQRTKLQTTLIMVGLCSAVFLAALDVTIVTVAIPTISADFNSTAGYTWIGSAYLLANAAAAPSWGKLSDIWGRKPILLTAVGVFWVGSLLAGVSVNMGMLIVARAVQGIGGGGLMNLCNICVSDLFSMRKRGLYMGIISLVWALAGGFGPGKSLRPPNYVGHESP